VRLIRSWPQQIPPHRSYVQDDLERLVMTDHDYRVLAGLDDDLVLLEWDIAVGQEELRAFIARVRADPTAVLVAPYRLYEAHSGRPSKPAWAHRRFVRGDMFTEFISPGDEFCHLFGFGMVYLPRDLVRRYLADNADEQFNDVRFSSWHYRHSDRPNVPIMWDARPVHVHYDIAAIAQEAV
jgi:hypothetical protein